eukprot:554099-Pyramimonas_sp.AAC.1
MAITYFGEQGYLGKAQSNHAAHNLGLPGPLLHADALRTTYSRALRYNLDPAKYMRPQETWGRMAVKILCGDFYQLPPVPASASLLAPHTN